MSQKNVELVREAIKEFNAGDIGSRFDSLIDPRVDFRDELGEIDNRDDLRAYIGEFREALGGLHMECEEFRDLGHSVLVVVRQGGRGAASGADVEQRFTWIMFFEEGRCIRWRIYADHAEALEAAGLSE